MEKILESYKSYMFNERGFTDDTVVKYMSNVRTMIKKMNIKKVEEFQETIINNRLIDNFWEELQRSRPISDQTRVGYMAALKSWLKFLYDIKQIPDDISDKIKMPKARSVYMEGLSLDEQKNLRNYISTHLRTEQELRDAALIMFIWATATRISEALRLNVHNDSYIYFHTEDIRSGDFIVQDNRVYAHIQGKGKADRKLSISDDAIAYLNLYLHEREHKDHILFHNYHNRYNDNRRLTRAGAGNIFDRVFASCGIKRDKGVRTHILRHTAINSWIEAGIPVMQIIAMTGHSSPSGLDPYFKRNKKITDIFAEDYKSTGKIDDPRVKKMENLLRLRHSPKK